MLIATLRGFTLIELLVTMAIIGILASMAVAMFGEYKKKSYDSIAVSQARDALTSNTAAYSEGTFLCDFTIRQDGSYQYGGGSQPATTCLPGFSHATGVLVSLRAYAASSSNSSNILTCHNKGTDNVMFSMSTRYGTMMTVTTSFVDSVWSDIAGWIPQC